LAGVTAAVDYIASIGDGENRRERLVSAYETIHAHERSLSERFMAGIAEMPAVTLFGHATTDHRTATFAIDIEGVSPVDVERALGDHGVFVWSGDYYAWEVMHRLGRAPEGLIRVGFVHYNTIEEVDRVLAELSALI
jgi:selenocysteine lyase/cysteine desulfurase